MGLRGPKPTPKAILEARGSWRAKVAGSAANAPVEKPTAPSSMKGEARTEFNRAAKELFCLGVIARIDRAVLVVYAESWAEMRALEREIGEVVKASGWQAAIASGLLRARDRAADRCMKAAAQLGLTPSARSRVSVGDMGSSDRKESTAERFFRIHEAGQQAGESKARFFTAS